MLRRPHCPASLSSLSSSLSKCAPDSPPIALLKTRFLFTRMPVAVFTMELGAGPFFCFLIFTSHSSGVPTTSYPFSFEEEMLFFSQRVEHERTVYYLCFNGYFCYKALLIWSNVYVPSASATIGGRCIYFYTGEHFSSSYMATGTKSSDTCLNYGLFCAMGGVSYRLSTASWPSSY